jgi:hypothetical protein
MGVGVVMLKVRSSSFLEAGCENRRYNMFVENGARPHVY